MAAACGPCIVLVADMPSPPLLTHLHDSCLLFFVLTAWLRSHLTLAQSCRDAVRNDVHPELQRVQALVTYCPL